MEEKLSAEGASFGPLLQREPWRSEAAAFKQPKRRLTITLVVAFVALLAIDGWLIAKRVKYHGQIGRLRASMTAQEIERADQLVTQADNKLLIAVELVRRPGRLEPALHLSISLDSGIMYLEREGALLRAMPVQIGPERLVGATPARVPLATPRGRRTIARVMTARDEWDVPEWVYSDRGIALPPDRSVRGALGPVAMILDGGTVIYSQPSTGPLGDSTYVLPGAVRVRAEDLHAVLPSLTAGMRVYFY
jgi:hypothetical protein